MLTLIPQIREVLEKQAAGAHADLGQARKLVAQAICELVETLSALDPGVHSAAIVRLLQVDDLNSQVLGCAESRLVRVQAAAQVLERFTVTESIPDDISELLNDMMKQVSSPAEQSTLDTGSIELF